MITGLDERSPRRKVQEHQDADRSYLWTLGAHSGDGTLGSVMGVCCFRAPKTVMAWILHLVLRDLYLVAEDGVLQHDLRDTPSSGEHLDEANEDESRGMIPKREDSTHQRQTRRGTGFLEPHRIEMRGFTWRGMMWMHTRGMMASPPEG